MQLIELNNEIKIGINLIRRISMTNKLTLKNIGPYRDHYGYYFTADGQAYRQTGETLQKVNGSRIGTNGHVIMTIAGQTIYLARMIYCLFNDIEYYDFKDRIRYVDGDYSNCTLTNIAIVPKRTPVERKARAVVDSWAIRQMYVSGMSAYQINQMTGVNEQRITNICAGFDKVTIEQIADIMRVVNVK